jgi:hypothetical protein
MTVLLTVLGIIAGIILLAKASFMYADKKLSGSSKQLRKMGYEKSKFIDMGFYVGWHPDISDDILYCLAYFKDGRLEIHRQETPTKLPVFVASIDPDSVTDIVIKEAMETEKLIVLFKSVLNGRYHSARSVRRKMANIVISWNDGDEHSASFYFNTIYSMAIAERSYLKLRNCITPKPHPQQQKPVKKRYTPEEVVRKMERKLADLERLNDKGQISQTEFIIRQNKLLTEILKMISCIQE